MMSAIQPDWVQGRCGSDRGTSRSVLHGAEKTILEREATSVVEDVMSDGPLCEFRGGGELFEERHGW